MQRCRFAVSLSVITFLAVPAGHAQADLCQAVAHHLWSDVASIALREQTPLAALVTAGAVHKGGTGLDGLAKPGQSIADALIQDHAADPDLARKLRDLPPTEAMRLGDSDIWLLDRVDGTLGCHTATTVAVPPTGVAQQISLPGDPDPTALCSMSALAAVAIDGVPALWMEQSGAFSNSLEQSTITIAGLHDEGFGSPCEVTVDYAVTDQATHAFCVGVDCVPLIRTAETLAMRLRREESAESLGAGAIANQGQDAEYRRMADIMADGKQPAELPTFGVAVATPYLVFADEVTFPARLGDGQVYLVRMGHGGFGWRQTADTLVAVYRLRDDQLAPVASVYVSARRTGISGVAVK